MSEKREHNVFSSVTKAALLASLAVLFLAACTKTFLVSKDCITYFFGSNDESFYRILCTSGDLQKILSEARLPGDKQAGLYKAQCSDRSRNELNAVYTSLTSDQQEALKSAFRMHGYEINGKPAPNFKVYPYYDNVNFCPPEQQY